MVKEAYFRLTPQAKKAAPADCIHSSLLAGACIRSGFTIKKYSSDFHWVQIASLPWEE